MNCQRCARNPATETWMISASPYTKRCSKCGQRYDEDEIALCEKCEREITAFIRKKVRRK